MNVHFGRTSFTRFERLVGVIRVGADARPRPLGALAVAGLMIAWALLLNTEPTEARAAPKPQTISPAGARSPQIAVDRNGRATAVWYRFNGSYYRIESRRQGADRKWGPTRVLSPPGEDAERPRIVIDSHGRATVTWYVDVGTFGHQVQSRRLRADGTLEPLRRLSPPSGDAFLPKLAVDREDRVTVVWHRYWAHVVQSRRLRANGAPESIRTLSAPSQEAVYPEIATDPQGRATVVWYLYDIGTWEGDRIQSRRLSSDGPPLGPIRTLSPGADQDWASWDPMVAVDPQGGSTVVWSRGKDEPLGNTQVQSRRLSPSGVPLGPMRGVSGAGDRSFWDPKVAVDSRGRATVIWEGSRRSSETAGLIQSRRLRADGSLEPIRTLVSPPKHWAEQPQVATRGDRAIVIWARRLQWQHGTYLGVQSMSMTAAGAPGPTLTLSRPDYPSTSEPHLALDSKGGLTAVWLRVGEYTNDAGRIEAVQTR
jgi:hypothetical protein